MNYRDKLNAILVKEPNKLTDEEFRYLVSKIGYLSFEEREKFASILLQENLLPSEKEKYQKVHLLHIYFK